MQFTAQKRSGIRARIRGVTTRLAAVGAARATTLGETMGRTLAAVRASGEALARTILTQPVLAAVAVRVQSGGAVSIPTGGQTDDEAPHQARRFHFSWTHERAVMLFATVLSIALYTWYSNHGQTLAYTDAISHMMIARRTIASHTPGIGQLGSVWLPLSHIMMLPFIWQATLFHDGFAGAFPSMLSYLIVSVYCYKSGLLFSRSRLAGWACALVFMLNPNVLYMQTTAMTELPLLAAAVVGVYYLAVWSQSLTPRHLVFAAAAMMAGTLVRYDAWAMVLAAVPVVIFISWRKQGRKAASANIQLFGLLAFVGCAGWFLYNWLIFKNALYFYNGPYSAKAQQQAIQSVYGLATKGNVWLSSRVYIQSVIDSVSVPLIVLAGLGVLLWVYREWKNPQGLALVVSFVPLPFNVLSLYLGISILTTPDVPSVTFGGLLTYFNVRYGMMMVPALALAIGYLASRVGAALTHLPVQRVALLESKRIQRVCINLMVPALVVLFAVTGGTMTPHPYVLQDPIHGVGAAGSIVATKAGTWLKQHYTGKSILISYNPDASVMFQSGLPDSAFITDSDGALYQSSISSPQSHVQFIVLDTAAGNPIWEELHTRTDWQHYFKLVYDNGSGKQIFERIGSN